MIHEIRNYSFRRHSCNLGPFGHIGIALNLIPCIAVAIFSIQSISRSLLFWRGQLHIRPQGNHLRNPANLGDFLQLLIVQITCTIRDSFYAAMTGNDRRTGQVSCLHHCLFTSMGDINHNPIIIHSPHQIFTQRREAIPFRPIIAQEIHIGTIAKLVMAKMSNAHIAHAALSPHRNTLNTFPQGVGVFYTNHDCIFSGCYYTADIRSCFRELKIISMFRDKVLDGSVTRFSNFKPLRIAIFIQIALRRVDNPKPAIQPPRLKLGQVHLQICRTARVNFKHVSQWNVDVSIER